jgi:hypothetical protein
LLIGTRIARVRLIFKIPSVMQTGRNTAFPTPSYLPRFPLAYVEWFTPPKLSASDQRSHNMLSVSKAFDRDGKPAWSIIPLTNIRQSCMLIPHFGKYSITHGNWVSDHIIDAVDTFVVNNWQSLYSYRTLY